MIFTNNYKIIHSYIKAKHDLGFLKPDGTFYKVRWGKHEKWAGKYIVDNDLREEQEKFEIENFAPLARDFLICQKNFIILNCPCDDDELFIIYRKMTKRQKEFLIELLIKINDQESIKKVLEV